MSIILEAKPIEIQVEIPGYGNFKLRRLGAGAEAEIMKKLREASEENKRVTNKFKDVLESEKNFLRTSQTTKLEELKATAEYQSAKQSIEKAAAIMQGAVEYSNERMLSLWNSDDQKSLEKLLNDFTIEQLRALYQQAISKSNTHGDMNNA